MAGLGRSSWVAVVVLGALLGALLGAVGTAHAQDAATGTLHERAVPPVADTFETPRSLAMGLGARASATSTAAVGSNAAGLSIGRHSHIEATSFYEPQGGRFGFGTALVDSHSGPIHAGLAFRYLQGNGANGHGGLDGRVALALPFGESFGIGLTGRYVSFWREGNPNATSAYAEGFTFDASVRVTPIPGLHIAALGINLIDVGSPLVPVQTGGSISYTIDSALTLAFDGLADLSTWHNADGTIRPEAQFGGVVEYFTGEVPIRVGYAFDTGRDVHLISGGLGWTNRELGFEMSVRQQLNGPQHTWLMASFRYLVH